ncbi:MAG: hypothetical protein E6R04_03225 [Spirochaetes bacterium]|nr:MAG: hypothetical protein E6R04_03225 [Spirochaetota bacterium]
MALTPQEEQELAALEAEAAGSQQPQGQDRSQMKYSADNVGKAENLLAELDSANVGKVKGFARGFESATGVGDESAGLGAGLYELLNREPDDTRSAGERFKAGFAGGRADEVKQMDHAYDVQPDAYALGKGAGIASQAAITPASVGAQSAIGAAQGFASGESLLGRLGAAAVGAVVPVGLRGLGKSAGEASDELSQRVVQSTLNIPKAERDAILREYGEEGLYAVGEELRKRGIGNQPGQSASEILDLLKSNLKSEGSALDAGIAKIASPQQTSITPVVGGLEEQLYGPGASEVIETASTIPISRVRAELLDPILKSGKDPAFVGKAARDVENILKQYGDEMSFPQLQEFQKTLAERANAYANSPLKGTAKYLGDIAQNVRQTLGQLSPEVASAQRNYAVMESAMQGAANPVSEGFARMSPISSIASAYRKTVGGPEVQSSINGLLEKATSFQGGKYAALLDAATKSGSVQALLGALFKRDPEFGAYLQGEGQ